MTEPHIRRLSLLAYAALAVSKVIYFGESEADHASMPALVQVADLSKLLIFAIRDIKSQDEVAQNLGISATAVAIETLQKKVYSLVRDGVLPAYDPYIFLRVELSQIATNRDDYLVRLDDVSAWLKTQGIEVGYAVGSKDNDRFTPSIEKTLGTNERNQLLKMVLGMAIDSYGYDPMAKKNDATKQIVDDLAKLGIGIDADTVRKYLKEAANTVTYEIPKP